ncbi:LacI family DNA-binding transcriptional regulator [Devosia sp. SL43]|uniref:LacI family DNA-binding transcriptional regulator n=1 Tax=Devosia sp. SL43 TaxID=2806348 RepID=UPI001F247D54|nr:LacI family DNA-binding transcriptional regulator [Devosia sp. SL43]UJW87334.1 LacI family DNA-binding transcriptional regulator [Devosia sp. SL43]
MVTIKDVAKAANVSIATVSRVVNNYAHVRPAVREAVAKAIAELGYRPNGLASSFRTQQSNIVGVLLRQQRTPFSSALAYAIETTMFDQGYRVLLCSTNGDPEREEAYLETMLDMRAQGVIIRPSAATARTVKQVNTLRDRGIAVSFVDMKPKMAAISSVVCDNFSGGYQGMRHLIELGHRKIGIVAGKIAQKGGSFDVGSERVRGIRQAAQDLATDVEIVFSPPFDIASFEVGREAGQAMITGHRGLTAIFATTDMLAIGVMHAAHALDLDLPRDLSILGYDGVLESSVTFPTLSTIAQPIHEMGQIAATTLIDHMTGASKSPRQVVLENTLIQRSSTIPLPE